jgi:lysophospholipase L1-like esterase
MANSLLTKSILICSSIFCVTFLFGSDVAKWDPRMANKVEKKASKSVKWIDGKTLPIEGRVFNDVTHWYDRLPSNVTAKVNAGVRSMKSHSAGMKFRFITDSKKLHFKWSLIFKNLSMIHMPATGVSGIDVYRYDSSLRKWIYVMTSKSFKNSTGYLSLDWTPGTPCLVNLPLYNGIRNFYVGVENGAKVSAVPAEIAPRGKPVVFYGTSITHGGCASRPGMAFVNIVGRELNVPVVNLGFSGSGVMEYEMSEHLAKIDASCYVLDCLWNMGHTKEQPRKGRNVDQNYEKFIRSLRAKRPKVPIIMAEQCDVFMKEPNAKDRYIKTLYKKLLSEGWTNLYYLSKDKMYSNSVEGTVDGCHPNDLGMASLAVAFGDAVRKALAP